MQDQLFLLAKPGGIKSLNCPSRHVRPISQGLKFSQAYLQLDKQSGQHLRWRDDNHVYLMPSRRAGATALGVYPACRYCDHHSFDGFQASYLVMASICCGSKLSVRYGGAISSSLARSLMHRLPKNEAFAFGDRSPRGCDVNDASSRSMAAQESWLVGFGDSKFERL